MFTICKKIIARKCYRISFVTYPLTKVYYIKLLIGCHFLFLGPVPFFVPYS